MYICIYVYILKRNYVGFDPQWTRYVGGRLKSGSSPIFFYKTMHGIDEVLNVFMIKVNKCICVYILRNWVVDDES